MAGYTIKNVGLNAFAKADAHTVRQMIDDPCTRLTLRFRRERSSTRMTPTPFSRLARRIQRPTWYMQNLTHLIPCPSSPPTLRPMVPRRVAASPSPVGLSVSMNSIGRWDFRDNRQRKLLDRNALSIRRYQSQTILRSPCKCYAIL
jgi:hypothetical protein